MENFVAREGGRARACGRRARARACSFRTAAPSRCPPPALSHRATVLSGAMLRIVVACLLAGVPAGFAQMIGHHALENPSVRT